MHAHKKNYISHMVLIIEINDAGVVMQTKQKKTNNIMKNGDL
jgi:hypothetical protein